MSNHRPAREVSVREFRANLRNMFEAAARGEVIAVVDTHRGKRLGLVVAHPDAKGERSTAA